MTYIPAICRRYTYLISKLIIHIWSAIHLLKDEDMGWPGNVNYNSWGEEELYIRLSNIPLWWASALGMQMKLVSQRGGGGAREDAHTTWLVLLIKDGRGPAGNYPLISTPLLRAMLTPRQEPFPAPQAPAFSFPLKTSSLTLFILHEIC